MKIAEKKYKARSGSYFSDEKAEAFGKYIETKKFETPEAIYNDARDNIESPFYKELEWDNDKAADAYRITQIKNIVNHISVEIVYTGGEIQKLERALVYVNREGGKQILPIELALQNPTDRNDLIKEAWANLEGWMERNRQYKEFEKVIEAAEWTRSKLQEEGLIASMAV